MARKICPCGIGLPTHTHNQISDAERLDWLESNWDPRYKLKSVLHAYELDDITIRQAIDAAMRAEKAVRGKR